MWFSSGILSAIAFLVLAEGTTSSPVPPASGQVRYRPGTTFRLPNHPSITLQYKSLSLPDEHFSLLDQRTLITSADTFYGQIGHLINAHGAEWTFRPPGSVDDPRESGHFEDHDVKIIFNKIVGGFTTLKTAQLVVEGIKLAAKNKGFVEEARITATEAGQIRQMPVMLAEVVMASAQTPVDGAGEGKIVGVDLTAIEKR